MPFYNIGGSTVHVMEGGPTLQISVDGRIYDFEMHRYCGPVRLNKKGDPHRCQTMKFVTAASLWAQQGERMENGLAVWDHPPEEILKHLRGNHYQIVGYTEPRRGS